ncbi:hypothetical protein F4806DRAFT_491388 [Annulohypoxylon nitens]|nr:hypothetical protein F4806DRAFT_491388 [Annulohypoxylon nitens]
MGRPTDTRSQSISTRHSVVKPDPYKQNLVKQHRHKSQPFDPDDLRRRLYVVIAEQEASKEKKKRRERLAEAGSESGSTQSKVYDTPTRQPETAKSGPNESSFAARVTRRKSMASDPAPPPKDASTQAPQPRTGRSMSKSIQDKLRRRSIISSSKVEPPPTSTSTTEHTAQSQTQPQPQQSQAPTYHHVPQSAAAQFERTTTANGMREQNLVHRLSQAGLKHRASLDPTQQQALCTLERTHSNRDKPHFQNPFQTGRPVSSSSRSAATTEDDVAPNFRRHSVIGLTQIKMRRRSSAIGNIAEDETMQTFAVGVHPTLGVPIEIPIDEISSEETLAVPIDPATAAEHRVDWTQSDEQRYEKPRAMSRIPLLKKADSLWTLKGRLGGRNNSIAAPGSGGKGEHQKMKLGSAEKHGHRQDEGGFASTSPKFLKFGFLARFKRSTAVS